MQQYQQEMKRVQHRGEWLEYIEVQPSDIALANKLAHEVLGRTLDEMPPQTRKLLVLLKGWVQDTAQQQAVKPEELRFTRRNVRAALNWGDTQLKIHLARRLEMEYLILFRRGLTYEYGLLWDGEENGQPHLCGLLEVVEGEAIVMNNEGSAFRSESETEQSAPGRGAVGDGSGNEKAASGQAAQGVGSKSGRVRAKRSNKGKKENGAAAFALVI